MGAKACLGARMGDSGCKMNASQTLFALLALCSALCTGASGRAAEGAGAKPFVPQLIDPERRIERNPLPRGTSIRFLTEEDYPPFNYVGRDGQMAGFNIDLARAICAELNAQCTLQPRRWELLMPALDAGEGDAVIASHRLSAELRATHEVSLPTFRSPARFVARAGTFSGEADVAALRGKAVALVGGSAHEAWLNTLYPGTKLVRFENVQGALAALKAGEADLAFGDGVALAFWLNGAESAGCCAFFGGAYTESRFFGEGAGIVLRPNAAPLRHAIDHALWRINRDGRYARLYLKHFPISPW